MATVNPALAGGLPQPRRTLPTGQAAPINAAKNKQQQPEEEIVKTVVVELAKAVFSIAKSALENVESGPNQSPASTQQPAPAASAVPIIPQPTPQPVAAPVVPVMPSAAPAIAPAPALTAAPPPPTLAPAQPQASAAPSALPAVAGSHPVPPPTATPHMPGDEPAVTQFKQAAIDEQARVISHEAAHQAVAGDLALPMQLQYETKQMMDSKGRVHTTTFATHGFVPIRLEAVPGRPPQGPAEKAHYMNLLSKYQRVEKAAIAPASLPGEAGRLSESDIHTANDARYRQAQLKQLISMGR